MPKNWLLTIFFSLLTGSAFSQSVVLYSKDGITASFTTTVLKSVFCDSAHQQVNFIRLDFTVSNNSSQPIRLNFYIQSTGDPFAYCITQEGILDFDPSGNNLGAGNSTYGLLNSGGVVNRSLGNWFYEDYFPASGYTWYINYQFPQSDGTFTISTTSNSASPPKSKPGYGISQTGDVIVNPKPMSNLPSQQGQTGGYPTINSNPANNSKSSYGISQQGDVVVNPKNSVNYSQQQQAQNASTANAMAAWQNSNQQAQNETTRLNNLQNELKNQQIPSSQTQQSTAAKAKDNQVQQQIYQQQKQYRQAEANLENAKQASMTAYDNAINSGKSGSAAVLDATIAGAQQITDPKGALIYTGVGLGVSLFMQLSEKKEAQHQQALDEEAKERREALIIQTKTKFIQEALDINKYTISDLLSKDRFAALLLVPNNFNTEEQPILFTYPLEVPMYSDGTYPLKPEIEKKMIFGIGQTNITNRIVYTLYPITDLDKFTNDFIRKMGSGKVILLNASLLNVSTYPFADTNQQASQTDFWGNPIKKIEKANPTTENKKDKTFWDQ